jgi:hypothetical protein
VIYLASPYSENPDVNVRAVAVVASAMAKEGHQVFSPILHWHHAAKWCDLPTDPHWWWGQNVRWLELASSMCVATIEGWNRSVGVEMEIEWWENHRPHSPITFRVP